MANVERILESVLLPEFAEARQTFDAARLDDEGIRKRLAEGLSGGGLLGKLEPGRTAAITAGSRGISRIDFILTEIVFLLKQRGVKPFVTACMGSHGGDAAGQMRILAHLGITEEKIGAPVLSSDELVTVGRTPDGRPVYADKAAFDADAVIVVNRIKPHTAFRAPVESGLQKMLAIGLGKQKGADACHARGFDGMYENVTSFASVILGGMNIAAGIGILENAYGEVCDIAVLPGEEIREREPDLLQAARSRMPKLFFDDIDVLVVSEMGKDISGSGMDTNVIGRYPTPFLAGGPGIARIAVLDLTDGSEGNAHGVGFADFISRGLFEKIDKDGTYPNCLTNKVTAPAKIPPVMPSDLHAVKAAIKTCPTPDPEKIRAVWIKNTHDLERIYISKALIMEAEAHPNLSVEGKPMALEFSRDGTVNKDLWK